jgi:integrase
VARPRGQNGSVEELGRTWRIRYVEERSDGTRVRRSKGGYPSKRAAAKALRGILAKIDDGSHVPESSKTVGAFLAEWLEGQRPHVADNSWVTCRNHVDYYLAPSDGSCAAYAKRTRTPARPAGLQRPSLSAVRLQDLTVERVSRHWSQLLERGKRDGTGLKPRTVRGVRITLQTALNAAHEAGDLPKPLKLRRVPVPRRPPTVFTAEQTGAFLQVAAGDRLAPMWLLMVTTAMRPSEVLGLRWSALDLDAGVLFIYKKLIKVDGVPVLRDGTKTDHSAAPIALDPAVVLALRDWRAAQRAERQIWPNQVEDNDLVFTREDSSCLRPDWVNRHFHRLAAAAGLPADPRLYDLRHGWATAALRAGIHPRLVQEVMRHSSYRTTADVYSHVMPTSPGRGESPSADW